MNKITIDPLVDFACHLLLGSPDHPRITIHFLNAILKPTVPITEVRILNPLVGKDFADDKCSILDILATDSIGRKFNIEVQRSLSAGLAKRLVFYVATQFIEQIGEGDNYQLIRPTIGICILDAMLFPKDPGFHHDFQLRSHAGLSLTDCLQIHLLELPKYELRSDNEMLRDAEHQWLYFLRGAYGANSSDLLEQLPDPVFAEAVEILEMIQRSPEERRYYEARLKAQRDEKARLEYAESIGEARGEARGEALGEARGRLWALQEQNGLPVSTKEQLDSMSVEEILQLYHELQKKLSN